MQLQRGDPSLEQEGEGLPFGAACTYPGVGWLGNHILEKGKSSYISDLARDSPLVIDILFLTNRELKGSQTALPSNPCTPTHTAFPLRLSSRHQNLGFGFFPQKNASSHQPNSIFCNDVVLLPFSKDLPFYSKMYAFVYIHDPSYYKNIQKSQQIQ